MIAESAFSLVIYAYLSLFALVMFVNLVSLAMAWRHKKKAAKNEA